MELDLINKLRWILSMRIKGPSIVDKKQVDKIYTQLDLLEKEIKQLIKEGALKEDKNLK